MNENKNWYALYTRQGRERKVAETLSRRKIETYCPYNKVMRPWSDPKKLIPEPLFKSQVFVKISETEFPHIVHTDGVISFLHWLGKPAVISEPEIEAIRGVLSEHGTVKLQKIGINMNPSVTAIGDLLLKSEDYQSDIENKNVKVILPSLGYLMMAGPEAPNTGVIFRNIVELEAQAG